MSITGKTSMAGLPGLTAAQKLIPSTRRIMGRLIIVEGGHGMPEGMHIPRHSAEAGEERPCFGFLPVEGLD